VPKLRVTSPLDQTNVPIKVRLNSSLVTEISNTKVERFREVLIEQMKLTVVAPQGLVRIGQTLVEVP
jgi:hypothetical protein